MSAAHVLLVDDDPDTLALLARALGDPSWRLSTAEGAGEALATVERDPVDCVVTDVFMPGTDGFALLTALREGHPEVQVILHTGYGSLDDAVRAVGGGAAAYLPKPARAQELRDAVRAALERAEASRRTRPSGAPVASRDAVVGRSPAVVALFATVARAASTTAPVLVHGETGVGKEWVARAIHRHGPRARAPFVAVNCSALAEGTLESELFGHARGGFTGAVGARKGMFLSAHGGTLFLDEVAELSPRAQAELLRVLQEGELRPVGSDEPVRVDVRVVAATRRELARLVAAGAFREDLLFRLRVVEIAVPPLRERPEDIPLLAEHFLAHAPGGAGRRFARETLAALAARAWPGNVRELQSAVQRAAALAGGEVILPRDLPPVVRDSAPPSAGTVSLASLWEALLAGGVPSLEEVEESYVRAVTRHLGGNKTQAADALGVDRKTLRRILARGGDAGED